MMSCRHDTSCHLSCKSRSPGKPVVSTRHPSSTCTLFFSVLARLTFNCRVRTDISFNHVTVLICPVLDTDHSQCVALSYCLFPSYHNDGLYTSLDITYLIKTCSFMLYTFNSFFYSPETSCVCGLERPWTSLLSNSKCILSASRPRTILPFKSASTLTSTQHESRDESRGEAIQGQV